MTQSSKRLPVPPWVWILGAALLAVAPMIVMGNAWGHDYEFHVVRWMDASEQFKQGVLFPRWAAGAYGGLGEPFLIFYPPLSWMTGALLGWVLPWKWALIAFAFSVFAISGASMWKLAREWLEPRDALLASTLYAWSPYLMVMGYKRWSYGEFLASAFFPLLIWGAIRIERDGSRIIPPLAAAFAAMWLSDLPAGVIASYSLALLLAVSSLVHRSWRPLIYGSIAIVSAFACIAFFMLPAAVERSWVEISRALREDWRSEVNFLFTTNTSVVLSALNRWLSMIAVLFMLVTGIAAVLTRPSMTHRREDGKTWYMLVALAAGGSLVMFRQSALLWRILPNFEYIEFPWRWLTVLTAVGTLLVSAAIARMRLRRLLWMAASLAIAGMAIVLIYTVRWDVGGRQLNAMAAAARAGKSAELDESKDWSLPMGSHPAEVPETAPPVVPLGDLGQVEIHVEKWAAEQKSISVRAAQPVTLKIKLLNYPAWQGRVNGAAVKLGTDPGTGEVLLPVPAGESHAEIAFGRTGDRTAGMLISWVSVVGLALFAWYGSRRKSPGTSTSEPVPPPPLR